MENRTRPGIEAKSYHPLIVSLHWLIALIILSQALVGVGILHFWPNNAIKVAPLTLHMILGITTLVLIVIQILARFLLPRPASPNGENGFLRFVSKATHLLLYLFTLLMGGSGILLALQSHVLQLVVGGKVRLPMYFAPFLHAAIFVMFGLLVGFHVLGALYHHFIVRDRPFARMGFSRVNETVETRPAGTV